MVKEIGASGVAAVLAGLCPEFVGKKQVIFICILRSYMYPRMYGNGIKQRSNVVELQGWQLF